MLRGRERLVRGCGVFLLLVSLLVPIPIAVSADGPAIAPLTLPVGPGTLTSPRIGGNLPVWQDTPGVFGIDPGSGPPLPIPAAGAREPGVPGTLIGWKQGTTAANGLDPT